MALSKTITVLRVLHKDERNFNTTDLHFRSLCDARTANVEVISLSIFCNNAMFSCLYHDLCRFQALLSDDLQEWYRVPVVPFEHFSDDGEEVPHSLWLSTSQGPKERTPLGGARGRRRRKVVDVTEHDRGWNAELDEDFLDVVLEVFSVQAPRRGVV